MRWLEEILKDEEVLRVAAIAAGAVAASETGSRLLRPFSKTETKADDNLLFGGMASIGLIFASTEGVVRRIGIGMISWGVGKLLWRNLVRPIVERSLASA